MSLAQINATTLLCRLLELEKPEINGLALLEGEQSDAGRDLLRERLLVIGPSLSWVTCPECGVELARVVRELAHEQILLRCDECGEVSTRRALQETYKVSLSKMVDRIMIGLGTVPSAKKDILTDKVWRIGVIEPARGKAQTVYFARHLHDQRVAHRLLEQMQLDKAKNSARIITSCELPLPQGSLLTDFDVVNLGAVARISQSKFEFFKDRLAQSLPLPVEDVPLGTTLRHVRTRGKAYINAIEYDLEPVHVRILLALMDDFDHEMERSQLRSACNSEADPFSPRKLFDRQLHVYRTFIDYRSGDKVYALLIPPDDGGWLN